MPPSPTEKKAYVALPYLLQSGPNSVNLGHLASGTMHPVKLSKVTLAVLFIFVTRPGRVLSDRGRHQLDWGSYSQPSHLYLCCYGWDRRPVTPQDRDNSKSLKPRGLGDPIPSWHPSPTHCLLAIITSKLVRCIIWTHRNRSDWTSISSVIPHQLNHNTHICHQTLLKLPHFRGTRSRETSVSRKKKQ